MKNYEKAQLEIISFDAEDVIATSEPDLGIPGEGGDGNNTPII